MKHTLRSNNQPLSCCRILLSSSVWSCSKWSCSSSIVPRSCIQIGQMNPSRTTTSDAVGLCGVTVGRAIPRDMFLTAACGDGKMFPSSNTVSSPSGEPYPSLSQKHVEISFSVEQRSRKTINKTSTSKKMREKMERRQRLHNPTPSPLCRAVFQRKCLEHEITMYFYTTHIVICKKYQNIRKYYKKCIFLEN